MPGIKSFDYSDILGWSSTRYDMFTTCQRQYFYHYYSKFDRDVGFEKLKQLKALTSVPLEIGNLTHECIADLLKRLRTLPDEPIDRTRFDEHLASLARGIIRRARFSEVYYKQVGSIELRELTSESGAALNNLFGVERYNWITKEAVRSREEWIIEPYGFGETRVGELKAYCKVDFLFPVAGFLYIFDWKTGKERPDKHASQILGYAAWAAYHFDKPVTNIRPIVAYLLPEYKEITHELHQEEMLTFQRMVTAQTQEMYAMCTDVKGNIPKQKDAFPLTKFESYCRYCNYRELCNRV